MNRKDLIKEVAKKSDLPQAACETAVLHKKSAKETLFCQPNPVPEPAKSLRSVGAAGFL